MPAKKTLNLSANCRPIVVMGAGAAGMGCALAAASAGAPVVLVEKFPEFGGTVKHALIHTIGGLFDDEGELLNKGLPAELVERLFRASPHTEKRRIGKTWVLNVDPVVYAQVTTDWIYAAEGITSLCEAELDGYKLNDGFVSQLSVSNTDTAITVQPHALVDTTGNAEVVSQLNSNLVADGMALGGYILQLRGIDEGALSFPKGIGVLREIRKAVEQGKLPQECSTVWLDTGVYPDEVYAKFSVSVPDYQQSHMQEVAAELLSYLHDLPGFAGAQIHTFGQLGIRDGGRIQGEYCLTEADVTASRKFEDAACQASWPIEHWHPQKGITLEYLPQGKSYDIPLRSLKVSGMSNLWAAGKCLSAEPRAQASARVAGTCWAMGEAVGKQLAGSWTA